MNTILRTLGPLFPILIAWGMFWKGTALWHAARKGSALWFIVILLVNTFGILEIIYLFAILKLKVGELFKK